MTEAELFAAIKAEALAATVTPDEFLHRVATQKGYKPQATHWYKALVAAEQLKHLPPPPPPVDDRVWLFRDDFDGPAGSPPDPTKWWATPWPSNGSLVSNFVPGNAFLDGQGHLVLRASPGRNGIDWYGARVQTFVEGDWPPGKVLASVDAPCRIEVGARFAPGAGLWGSIWTNSVGPKMPANLELDLQEFRGAVPHEIAVHTHGLDEEEARSISALDLSMDFHTYWCEYRKDGVLFGCDDVPFAKTWRLPSAPPQMLRLSHEVGTPGTWGGQDGPPPDGVHDALFDFVHVWRI